MAKLSRGRPPKDSYVRLGAQIGIMLNEHQLKRLGDYCTRHNITRSEALRRGFELLFEQEVKEVEKMVGGP